MINNINSLNQHIKWLNTNSNNVANVNTKGFEADRIIINSKSNNSIVSTISSTNKPTNLTKELPEQISIKRGFEANINVIKTYDEIKGILIDLKK